MPRQVTLQQIELQAREGISRCRALTANLSEAQFLWRPAPASWSIAECIQHLNSSLAQYRRAMRPTFERERQNAPLAPAVFRIGFLASQFISLLEPPYRVKVKAPGTLLPPAEIDPHAALEEFLRGREEFLEFAREASRVDMSSIRFTNPVARFMKLSLSEAFLIMLAHDRRHLWQAENVRNRPDFPSA